MNQFDSGSLDWHQIAGWQQVTGVKLSPLEIEVMRAVDKARSKGV